MENPFADLERDIFRLLKQDGSRIKNLRTTGFHEGQVIFFQTDIDFEEGDTLERDLPHGRMERYLAEGIRYSSGIEDVPPHYVLSVREAEKPRTEPAPRTVMQVRSTSIS